MRGLRLFIAVCALGLAVVPAPTGAMEATDAGPELSVPIERLRASVRCPADLAFLGREVVLIVPPSGLNPEEAHGYNYMRAFDALGIPYCTVDLPDRSMVDIQVSSEYVVHAIRRIYEQGGRKVQVLGWSQPGAQPRWALRWWPDLREKVSEYVGITPNVHGGENVRWACVPDCADPFWQSIHGSNFVKAMNSGGETFPGIDYTVVWTHFDQFWTPRGATIAGATNIATQDICPANTADHFSIGVYDPVAYAIVLDALTHPGPADPTRIDPSVCTQALAPHVDPVMFPANRLRTLTQFFSTLMTYPHTPQEPPLKPYARNYPREQARGWACLGARGPGPVR